MDWPEIQHGRSRSLFGVPVAVSPVAGAGVRRAAGDGTRGT